MLTGSSLFVVLLSDAALERMKSADTREDIMLREMDIALRLQAQGRIVLMPILVNARRLTSFDGFPSTAYDGVGRSAREVLKIYFNKLHNNDRLTLAADTAPDAHNLQPCVDLIYERLKRIWAGVEGTDHVAPSLSDSLRQNQDLGLPGSGDLQLPGLLSPSLRVFWHRRMGQRFVTWAQFVAAVNAELSEGAGDPTGLEAFDMQLRAGPHRAAPVLADGIVGPGGTATGAFTRLVLCVRLNLSDDDAVSAGALLAMQQHCEGLAAARRRAPASAHATDSDATADAELNLSEPEASAASDLSLRACLQLLVDEVQCDPLPAVLDDAFQAALAGLKAALAPLDFEREIEAHVAKCGQRPTTRGWLLEEFDEWLRNPKPGTEEPAFIIQGEPGMGKSSFAALLCRARADAIAAVHFCDASDAETRDVLRMLKSLAWQLVRRVPALLPAVQKAAESAAKGDLRTPEALFDTLLLGPLLALNSSGAPSPGPIVLLIDALDEVESSEKRNKLLNLLTTRLRKLPSFVRLVLTCRPDPALLCSLRQLPVRRREIAGNDPRHLTDLRAHVESLLRPAMLASGGDDAAVQRGVKLLERRSESRFIYIARVEARLQDESFFTGAYEELLQLPADLDGTYAEYLSSSRVDPKVLEDAESLLQVLLAVQEPPTLDTLAWLCGPRLSRKRVALIMEELFSLFPLRGTGACAAYHPFHKTVVDFLVDRSRCGARLWVDVAVGHAALAAKARDELAGLQRPLAIAPAGRGACFAARATCVLRHGLLHARLADNDAGGHSVEPELRGGDIRSFAVSLPYYLFHAYNDPSLTRLIGQLDDVARTLAAVDDPTDPTLRTDVIDMLRWCRLSASQMGRHPEAIFGEAWSAPAQSAPARAVKALVASGGLDVTAIWHRVETTTAFPPLIAVLEGHTCGVESVVFSLDSTMVVSASQDGTVRLWAAGTGELLRSLEFDASFGRYGLHNVAISPDGSTVAATCSRDRMHGQTVGVWDLDATGSGEQRQMFDTSAIVHCVLFLNGRLVACASDKPTGRSYKQETSAVQIWTSGERRTFEGHTKSVSCVTISRDGAMVASGSVDGSVRLWATDTGGQLRVYTKHTDTVTSVAFSPDGTMLAWGSTDETVTLWAAKTGQLLHVCAGHAREVTSVAFSPDGTTVASGSLDKNCRLWSAKAGNMGQLLQVLEGHTDGVESVAFSLDGTMLASGARDNSVRLWAWAASAQAHEMLDKTPGHTGAVESVAISPDGAMVASASWDKSVMLWAAGTGELLQVFADHTAGVSSVVFSRDSTTVISKAWDRTVRVWVAATGRLLSTFAGPAADADSNAFLLELEVATSSKHVAPESGKQILSLPCTWDALGRWVRVTLPGGQTASQHSLVVLPPDAQPAHASAIVDSNCGDPKLQEARLMVICRSGKCLRFRCKV